MAITDAIRFQIRQLSGDTAPVPDVVDEDIDAEYTANGGSVPVSVLAVLQRRYALALVNDSARKKLDGLQALIAHWEKRQPFRAVTIGLGTVETDT